ARLAAGRYQQDVRTAGLEAALHGGRGAQALLRAFQLIDGESVIRVFDFVFSLLGLVVGFPVLLVLTIIGLFDTGSPIFRQVRVGRHQQPFTLAKFRTMKVDTASVATHLASSASITP